MHIGFGRGFHMNKGENCNKKNISQMEKIILTYIEIITEIGIILIWAILFLQVIGRYILKYPFAWPEEIAGFIFVWIVFLGQALAFYNNDIIAIKYFRNRLPNKYNNIIEIIVNFIVFLSLIILSVKGYEATLIALSRKTPTLRFSWGFVYVAFPIGLSLLGFCYLIEVFRNIKKYNFNNLTRKK